jgi:1-deoxy-D-xylulose-5-phosphate synthase
MSVLENFKLEDLKTMTIPELEELAKEIRTLIINTVSQNGGHLSSNLGVVELTIALHKVFNSPYDKLIFDVSHQTYAHKILTGRANQFSTLRQYGGLSGFARRSESIHDVYEAGHSSTALSAAIGYSIARETGEFEIGDPVAIVGDASFSNGLTFEALNFLGNNPYHKVIIIVNDNEMSISHNVGALSKVFNKIRIRKSYKWFSKVTPRFLRKLTLRVKESVKSYVFGKNIFDALGFKYFAGIDGNNFKELIKYLTYAKESKESIVLHIKTTKGKGYLPAEKDKVGIWHGVGPFDVESGTFKNKKEADEALFGEAVANTVLELAYSDSKIYAITPAMVIGSGLYNFSKELPNQLIDVGIAEENAVVMAAGMAQAGLKPAVFIYSTFLQRAYDQISHDVARTNSHVVFYIDRAGLVDDDGETHQGIYDIAFLRSIPGIVIIMPKDYAEMQAMVSYATYSLTGPVAIRYPKIKIKMDSNQKTEPIVLGKWEVLIPHSKKVVISYGPNLLEIKELIEKNQLDVGLINARFINPLDEELLQELAKNEIDIITYEEVIYNGSLGNHILEFANLRKFNINVEVMSLPDTYVEHGKVSVLKKVYNLSMDDLLNKIRSK